MAALGSCVVGWSNRSRIQEVHLSLNSRLDQLLEVTRSEAYKTGVARQKQIHLEEKSGIPEREL